MANARYILAGFTLIGIAAYSYATPSPFGSNESECQQISREKYKADMEYIKQELFDNDVLIKAVQDVHQIEMRACKSTLWWG